MLDPVLTDCQIWCLNASTFLPGDAEPRHVFDEETTALCQARRDSGSGLSQHFDTNMILSQFSDTRTHFKVSCEMRMCAARKATAPVENNIVLVATL